MVLFSEQDVIYNATVHVCSIQLCTVVVKMPLTQLLNVLFINLFIQSLRQMIVRTEKCTTTAGVLRV